MILLFALSKIQKKRKSPGGVNLAGQPDGFTVCSLDFKLASSVFRFSYSRAGHSVTSDGHMKWRRCLTEQFRGNVGAAEGRELT